MTEHEEAASLLLSRLQGRENQKSFMLKTAAFDLSARAQQYSLPGSSEAALLDDALCQLASLFLMDVEPAALDGRLLRCAYFCEAVGCGENCDRLHAADCNVYVLEVDRIS